MNSINNNLMALNVANNLDSHYGRLSTSVQRLSSGLRINSAADDAAGLAIRELMRADVAALNQGVRNANDAISMLQTADGALGVIDEKLIRMKELAEQAATGTYDSTQRLMIHSEFQAMASEIDRIARATDFNGIKLLDGSLSGNHDGSGLNATGAMKIHFGSANDSAEDYYYVQIGDCTLAGLGLRDLPVTTINAVGWTSGTTANANSTKADTYGGVPILSDVLNKNTQQTFNSGCITVGIIPTGTTNIEILLNDTGIEDTIQIFTRSGKHLAGIKLQDWYSTPPVTESSLITEANGFLPGASYDGINLNGTGNNITFIDENTYQNINYNGMNIKYTGDGSRVWPLNSIEKLTIDNVTEDLIFIVDGRGIFDVTANWTQMPTATNPPNPPNPPVPGPQPSPPQGDIISIRTQDEAQKALERIDDAIVTKDKVRAHLGALQNRLENTVTNLTIQGENLQTAESRISDVDVATEMTQFVRNQVLTQSAVAMLGQANSYPHMLSGLING